MAYHMANSPRDSGEALIHVKWGEVHTLTKPYYLFRQWAEPLKPGMRVVEVGVFGRGAPGVKSTAFLAPEDRALVVHVVNARDNDAPIALKLTGKFSTATTAERTRTSDTEDVKDLPVLAGSTASFTDTLPAGSIFTYRWQGTSK